MRYGPARLAFGRLELRHALFDLVLLLGLGFNLGGDDRCLVMGSDFPHAEGIANPADFEKLLDPLDDATKVRIMRTNASMLFER